MNRRALSTIAWLVVSSVIAPLTISPAMAFSCYRHIYNNTDWKWVFWATNEYGNVYFSGCANGASQNGPCEIRSRQTIDIQYTYTGGRTLGRMYIKDSSNVTKDFEYGEISNRCPVVEHQGPTGSVVVNSRADGDFTIIAGTWCQNCQ
jgi:hypothetical protein